MPTLDELSRIARNLNIAIPLIAVIVVFAFCLINIDKLILLKGILAGLFKGFSSKARKTHIASRIRGHAMKSIKSLNAERSGLLPNDLKIEWVKDEDKDTFIRNNQVVIRMRQSANPHENFVNAMMGFVSSGLLSKERTYFDKKVMQAADISIVKRLILEASKESLSFFNDKILTPLFESDDDLFEYLEDIATLDGNGMFVNILLNEFMKAGQKAYPAFTDPGLIAESKEFLYYLRTIARNEHSSHDELNFNREYFKTAVVLTANDETYKKKGIKPYTSIISKLINNGIESIYVFGLGRKIEVAETVVREIEKKDIRIIECKKNFYSHKKLDFTGRVRGICIEIRAKKI